MLIGAGRPAGERPRRNLGAAILASAACAALAAGAARAESGSERDADGRRLEGVVVTGVRLKDASSGTKTSTPLISTPQSVTVIDSEELIRRNAVSINQALGYVAGVAANQRGGMVTRYDQLLLRGFTPGVYLDGMRLLAGPYSMPQIDFNRIDQVDVVKGPASVLYGNSTPGGLVSLTSKRPEGSPFGRLEAQLGNYRFKRLAVDVNQPLDKEGRFLSRVLGGWQKGDGFTSGTFSERYHVSGALSFIPTPDTTLTVIAAYQHTPHGGGYSGVPAFGSILPSPLGKLPEDINTGDPAYERYNHKAKSITALLRHDFNAHLTLRSSFRFQNNDLSYRQLYVAGYPTVGTGAARNTDYSTIIRGGGGADEDFDTLTLDNNFNARFGTGAVEHNLLVGVDYQKITGENFQQFNTGATTNPLTSIPNLRLYAPAYGGVMPTTDLTLLSTAHVNTYTRREQVGVYVQDEIRLGQLRLIASGRQDWYKQHTLNKRNNTRTILDQSAFTMRLGALYELPIGLSPFVSYSESFEPQAGATWQGVPFVPVTGQQYEGGLKFTPKGTQAIFTLAAFELRRQKAPVGDPLAGTNGIPTNSQIQIGEIRVRGVELEARGEVAPGLNLAATASYTDAIITQGAPAVAATATSNGTPTTTGTRQLGTPKWAASAFVTYDLKGGDRFGGPLAGLTVGGGFRYVGASYGATSYAVINNVTTFQRFRVDSFMLVDAMVGYDLGVASPRLEGLKLAVNVANLLDERHVSACPFQNSCYFGASRTVIGSIRFAW